jgi:hypothetical protein
MQDIPFS